MDIRYTGDGLVLEGGQKYNDIKFGTVGHELASPLSLHSF